MSICLSSTSKINQIKLSIFYRQQQKQPTIAYEEESNQKIFTSDALHSYVNNFRICIHNSQRATHTHTYIYRFKANNFINIKKNQWATNGGSLNNNNK